MRRCLKRQGAWVGRLTRELIRQRDSLSTRDSLHEREVDSISKGKARKRYEFGTKVGITCTQKEGFVVGMRSYPGNPYDGHTLDDLLQQIEAMIGHMKNDGLLERCHLKGTEGDALHAILCAVGHNLRLLRAYWARLLLWLCIWVFSGGNLSQARRRSPVGV